MGMLHKAIVLVLGIWLLFAPITALGDTAAKRIRTDTTNFDTNLGAGDTTVQKALETIDEMAGGSVEGTAVLSTGETGGTKYLREDGDGTSSWQTPAGTGDLLADGTVPMTANWDVGNFDLTMKSLTMDGDFSLQSATDSTTAFQILDNDGGNPILNADTVNERVGIGTASPSNKLVIGEDNAKIALGAGEDASIYYDGSNMHFNSQEVGAGDFQFDNGKIDVQSTVPKARFTDTDGGWAEVSGSGGQFAFSADGGNTQPGSRIAFEVDQVEKMRIDLNGDMSMPGDVVIGAAIGTNPGAKLDVQNTTDAASNLVGIFRSGNRAIPADNDEGYISFYNDDDLGTQVEFSRMTWVASDVTNTTKDGKIEFATMVNNTLTDTLTIDGANVGIGTANPTEALDLVGNFTATGTISAKGYTFNIVAKTGAYTLVAGDDYATGDASGGAFTFTLPAVANVPTGKVYHIKKIDSSANEITVDGNGAETIDDSANFILSGQYEAITVVNSGSEWFIY